MRLKFLFVCLLLVLALPVAAQEDGLSEEENALFDRLVAAGSMVEDYTSYVVTYDKITTQDQLVMLGGQTQADTQSVTTTMIASVPNAQETPSDISAVATSVVEITRDGTVLFSYTVEAELRRVDGVLYVNAVYAEGQGQMVLPEGWVMIDDPENFPELDVLPIDELFEDADETDDQFLTELESWRVAATSVTSETVDLDGISAEAISISFDWQGLIDVQTANGDVDSNNPIFAGLTALLADAGDVGSLSVYIDEAGNVLGYGLDYGIDIQNADGSVLGSDAPAGMTFNLAQTEIRRYLISQVDEALDPVTAPEIE